MEIDTKYCYADLQECQVLHLRKENWNSTSQVIGVETTVIHNKTRQQNCISWAVNKVATVEREKEIRKVSKFKWVTDISDIRDKFWKKLGIVPLRWLEERSLKHQN